MRRFRTLRGRLTAVAVMVAAVCIAALTIAFNLVLEANLDSEATARLRTKAAAAGTTVTYDNGRLRVHESPDDTAVDQQVWIYEGRRAIERPIAGRQIQRVADSLAGLAHRRRDLNDPDYRFYAEPVTYHGRQVGTVVTGESLATYSRTTHIALVSSILLGAVLLAAVFALTWASIGRALAPVVEMTRSAAAWSEREPLRRFGAVDRPDELGALAETFDQLLDRVAASLRHEQLLSAELSHELRTPLARIVAEVELLQRRDRSAEVRAEAYASLARSAEQMQGILDTLMAAARAEARLDQGRSDVRSALEQLGTTWAPSFAERGVALEIRDPGAPLTVGVQSDVVERIVAPVLDNASRFARSRVTVEARVEDGRLVVTVADDGPGVPEEARERVFEPGTHASGNGHRGAGLGLALARRLARAANGDVRVGPPGPEGGAAFRIVLPT